MASSNDGLDDSNGRSERLHDVTDLDDFAAKSKIIAEATRRHIPRSSSPAKRLASEMEEEEGFLSPKEPMDFEPTPSPLRALSEPVAGTGTHDDTSPCDRMQISSPLQTDRQNPSAGSVVRLTDGTDATSKVENSSSGSDHSYVATLDSAASSITGTSYSSASMKDPVGGKQNPSGSQENGVPMPSLEEQVRQVTQIHTRELQEGQKGFVISNAWLSRVFARTAEGLKQGVYDKTLLEGDIGPVDNSSLVSEDYPRITIETRDGEAFVPLKPDLRMGDDFEVLPQEAWDLIMGWYGLMEGSPTIVRYAHDTSPEGAVTENIQYELYPPIFTIRKLKNEGHSSAAQTFRDVNAVAPRFLASRSELFQSFLKRVKLGACIDMNTKVQVWRVLDEPRVESNQDALRGNSGFLTPATSRSTSPATMPGAQVTVPLLIDSTAFAAMVEGTQREMIDVRDETMNEKYNGHLKLDTVGLAADQALILEEQIPSSRGEGFASTEIRKAAQNNRVPISVTKDGKTTVQSDGHSQNGNQVSRTNSAPSGMVTRGRAKRNGRMRGTVGLMNLGNTCYMNSALQCIRSVEELTMYFLQQEYKRDLNSGNPLGYSGAIAKAYAGLLASIYDDSAMGSFAPKNFKMTLGRCQPLFSGYGQQDSQEFLSFLVDGLHEDLNRVIKKPYIENPESDDNTINDPAAIRALGEKYRANHKARNDSVAMDLFSGFYKNTMVCPVCDKVSITFDPFSLLTLQLPVENTWQHSVVFAPLRDPPIIVNVDMDKNGTIRNLKEYVAQRIKGLRWDRLMAAEIYSNKFYRTLEDSQVIADSNLQPRDEIILYELDDVPTNFPPQKKKQNKIRSMLLYSNIESEDEIPDFESPIADRMVVPLFHRLVPSASYMSSRPLKLWPSFVLISRAEATDYDAVLRKVLMKVSTMTTRDFLSEDTTQRVPFPSRSDSDTIITTDEDASSNLDSRVHAGSVEGDDSVVEVSMSDGNASSSQEASSTGFEMAEGPSSRRQPTVLEPDSFISPEFRTLFEMKYLKSTAEVVPTGWTTLDGNKDYPVIASRIVRTGTRRSSLQSRASQQSMSSVSDDTDDLPEFSSRQTAPRDPVDADADSDDGLPSYQTILQHGLYQGRKGNRGKNKKGVTYSKKTKRGTATPVSESDNEPALIRPGEAIVLDWNAEAYNALFDGQPGDYMRGRETWKQMEVLPDPELEEKRVKRNNRKKLGVTLEDCFAETAKGEILSEENAWYCNRCKELRRASKTLEVWTVPDILVIHLKRFSTNRGFRDKIDHVVDFPTEGLDLTDRVGLKEGKELTYDLFAVDNHYGGLGGGHYTAFAQNFYDKKWYEYNDSHVSQRNAQSVVTAAAYLLFYRRRSEKPLGPPYLQNLVTDAYQRENESQTSSRANSPAGEGRRLDDFSRNGSSGALAGAGATLHQRGVGSAGVSPAKNENEDEIEPDGVEDDLAPPLTSFLDDSLDEGLDMNNGASDYDKVGRMGPLRLGYTEAPVWDFSKGPPAETSASDEEIFDDAASATAARGSNVGEELHDRLMTDFGDDVVGLNPRASTPVAASSSTQTLPDLVGEDGTVRVELEPEELEAPVIEVRVNEKDDLKLE